MAALCRSLARQTTDFPAYSGQEKEKKGGKKERGEKEKSRKGNAMSLDLKELQCFA